MNRKSGNRLPVVPWPKVEIETRKKAKEVGVDAGLEKRLMEGGDLGGQRERKRWGSEEKGGERGWGWGGSG